MKAGIGFALLTGLLVACGPSRPADTIDSPPPLCVDGATRCDVTTFQTCTGGTWQTTVDCPDKCDDVAGCVVCRPDGVVCSDGDLHQCTADGNVGPIKEACTGSNICIDAQCRDACQQAAEDKSYEGCEYYAVDLHNAIELGALKTAADCRAPYKPGNHKVCVSGSNTAGLCDPGDQCPGSFTCEARDVCVLDAQHAPFAIAISNGQQRPVDVTVTAANGQSATFTVPPGDVKAFFPQAPENNLPDSSIEGSGIAKKAYKITATLPVVAYQFNPLDNVDVFSNDASMLVPRTAFDGDYYVLSAPTLNRRQGGLLAPSKDNYRSTLSVVAWEDGTAVEVTPQAATVVGPSQVAITAMNTTAFTLNAGDVLNLEAGTAGTGDLTGSRVRVTNGKTVGVFGGHMAYVRPDDQACCADHLEEMMMPTSTWGKRFAITRAKPRKTETDMLRIMAQKPNTTINFNPAPATGACNTLAAGQFCEVHIQVDTEVISSEPVLVGHYLRSVGDIGDPSMAVAVPVEQYRKNYTFLVPDKYQANFVHISAPVGGVIRLDGQNVSGQLAPFGTELRGGRLSVLPGQHKIECPNSCGIEVYGYSAAVSYLFAGGLDLKKIVVN